MNHLVKYVTASRTSLRGVSMSARIPVLVLAGSDDRPAPVPSGLRPDDMLTGFKGAMPLPWGRCLAAELVERLRCSGRFADPIVIGPRHVYEELVDCEVVDAAGNLALTFERIRELIRTRFDAAAPIAVITCDVLPTVSELQTLMTESYDPHSECHFWGQLVHAEPIHMGAGHWKPSYRFRRAADQPLINLYPGHLVIVRPAALRIRLTSHMLRLAYSFRNVDLNRRWLRMILRGSGQLIAEDMRNLLRLKAPLLSILIPFYCLRAYGQYRRGRLTVPNFGHYVGKVFLHRASLHTALSAPVVFSITPIVSLAKDIDTKAEWAEAIRQGHLA